MTDKTSQLYPCNASEGSAMTAANQVQATTSEKKPSRSPRSSMTQGQPMLRLRIAAFMLCGLFLFCPAGQLLADEADMLPASETGFLAKYSDIANRLQKTREDTREQQAVVDELNTFSSSYPGRHVDGWRCKVQWRLKIYPPSAPETQPLVCGVKAGGRKLGFLKVGGRKFGFYLVLDFARLNTRDFYPDDIISFSGSLYRDNTSIGYSDFNWDKKFVFQNVAVTIIKKGS